ncbi:MAG: hypothetical protein J6Z23_05135 [Lachnospiraceae bacterium]|nr:hypothetical protein [Lachnospiraceae bacterium]
MDFLNALRFMKDVRYEFILPPAGITFRKMSKKEAAETFAWFMKKIPERMEYLRTRCAADLRISPEMLNYSDHSLLLLWRWFLKTARTEKTPKEILEEMIKGSAIFGDSYINKEVLSVTTHMIILDIALYIGECFIHNDPHLQWTYRTTPKNSVTVNQPVITGMIVSFAGLQGPADFAPIHMVGVQASKILGKTAEEEDLIQLYHLWTNNP